MDLSLRIHKNKYIIALLIFISYLCLSFYKIGDNGLWYDECFSIDYAQRSVDQILWYSLYMDTNPPGYLLIMHYWISAFGDSEMALRSLSALSTSLACGILFLFSLRFFNWQTAIFFILMFFVSNDLFYYSQEGRTYGLVLLLIVLSYYAFFKLIEKPTYLMAFLLGIFNICIFYLHTLACIIFIAQIILAPILGFDLTLYKNKSKNIISFFGFKIRLVLLYGLSWITFIILFLPWSERFFGILGNESKAYWLEKPTIIEYKKVLFGFYNSEVLFYVYVCLFALTIFLICFKKLRNEYINLKLLIFSIMIGPFLFHFNFFISGIIPIFLTRYVLFTILGFILLFAYSLSILKLDFKYKLIFLVILCGFSGKYMTIPREQYWDYKTAIEEIKKKPTATTFISTNCASVFAYYFDKNIFKKSPSERLQLLAKHNVFESTGTLWMDTVDFFRYKDIYITSSFGNMFDPTGSIKRHFDTKFKWVETLSYKGLIVNHYSNILIDQEILKNIKLSIINDIKWYNGVILQAKEENISTDSMLTNVAIWQYKNIIK